MLITDEERKDFICAKCKNSPPPLVQFLLLTDQDLLKDKIQEDEHKEHTINIDFGLQNFNPDMENCGLNSPENINQKADLTGMPDFPDIHDEDFLLAEELLANFDFIFDLD
jgi:hypothetical protein